MSRTSRVRVVWNKLPVSRVKRRIKNERIEKEKEKTPRALRVDDPEREGEGRIV